MSESNNLFEEFSPVSSEEWKNKIIDDLRGKPFEELLQHTDEGFDIPPFYTKENVQPLDIPMERQFPGWQIRQDFPADDFKLTNKKIINALENRVDAIGIRIKEAPNLEELSRLLKAAPLDRFSWHFFADEKTEAVLEVFLELLSRRKLNPASITGSFNLDPLCAGQSSDYDSLSRLLKTINDKFPKFKALTMHSQPFHMEGKSASEELAGIMGKIGEYWRGLSTNNHQLITFVKQVQFSVQVSPNYFFEVAKLRALRWLWHNWQQEMGISIPEPAFIHAQKSWKHNDQENPYHNILMHTTEAMAAVIGGCDVLNLRSLDKTDKLDYEFFERVSGNIHLILKHESNLDKVVDPAKGSYYVEALTKKIVEVVMSARKDNT